MDDVVSDGAVRQAAFAIVPRAILETALKQIDAIVRPAGDLYFIELRAQSTKLRFLPAMLRSDPSFWALRPPASRLWTPCFTFAARTGVA